MRSTKLITVRIELPPSIPTGFASLSQQTSPQGNHYLRKIPQTQFVNLSLQLSICRSQFPLLFFHTMNEAYYVTLECTSNVYWHPSSFRSTTASILSRHQLTTISTCDLRAATETIFSLTAETWCWIFCTKMVENEAKHKDYTATAFLHLITFILEIISYLYTQNCLILSYWLYSIPLCDSIVIYLTSVLVINM